MSSNRKLSYSLAINEALYQMMRADDSVMLIGQGVKSPWYVGNTAKDLIETFGTDRVIDTPVSENAVTGAAVGAAICGMRAVVVHPRMDFMLYAFDPIINEAANWHYMFGGKSCVPVVIWGIINRGGEQAAQHSQALHAVFSHVPGLKVVMPATPYDAKGLMVAAIKDNNPVMYVDDRWLYDLTDTVPEELYEVPIGKAIVRRRGADVTLVALSYMVCQAMEAARVLEQDGIHAEVLDLRTAKPLDKELLLESVEKTGKLVVVDGGWKTCGFSAEVITTVVEKAFDYLTEPPVRVTLPDTPAPSCRILEEAYYPSVQTITDAVNKIPVKSKIIYIRETHKLPLSYPDISTGEKRAVMEVMRTPSLSFGPKVEAFEKAGAEYVGRKYGVAVNSGTSGLHLIIRALNIGQNDKVITTPFSFIASANCMLFEKAIPVFVDIDKNSLNIDPNKIEAVLMKDKKKEIKAILAVDIFGHPADWDVLYKIAKKYKLKLIEDSCEAMGAEYQSPLNLPYGRWKQFAKAGSFGDASIFAFYPNKQITTGEGGLVLTDSKKIYDLCRSMRNQGRSTNSHEWFNHVRLGYNYRLGEISSSIGIAQLDRIEDILARRKHVAQIYNEKLKSIDNIIIPYSASNIKLGWFVYVIQLGKQYSRKDRDMILKKMLQRSIECRDYFSPIHLQPLYRKMFGYKKGAFPITEFVADRTIALPFFNDLAVKDIDYVVDNLRDVLEGH